MTHGRPEIGAKANIAQSFWARVAAIRRELKGIPLGWFTAGDIPALHRLLGIHRNIMVDPREDNLKRFEEIIANCERRRRILQQFESGNPVQGARGKLAGSMYPRVKHKRKRPRSKRKEMK